MIVHHDYTHIHAGRAQGGYSLNPRMTAALLIARNTLNQYAWVHYFECWCQSERLACRRWLILFSEKNPGLSKPGLAFPMAFPTFLSPWREYHCSFQAHTYPTSGRHNFYHKLQGRSLSSHGAPAWPHSVVSKSQRSVCYQLELLFVRTRWHLREP